MFRTLIFGLGALILGMLVYLYNEISALRQAPPQRIILTVKEGAAISIQPAGAPDSEATTLPPGRYSCTMGEVRSAE